MTKEQEKAWKYFLRYKSEMDRNDIDLEVIKKTIEIARAEGKAEVLAGCSEIIHWLREIREFNAHDDAWIEETIEKIKALKTTRPKETNQLVKRRLMQTPNSDKPRLGENDYLIAQGSLRKIWDNKEDDKIFNKSKVKGKEKKKC